MDVREALPSSGTVDQRAAGLGMDEGPPLRGLPGGNRRAAPDVGGHLAALHWMRRPAP